MRQWRRARRRRSPRFAASSERADREKKSALFYCGACDDEEDDSAHWSGESRDRLPQQVGHVSEEVARLDHLIYPNVTVKDPFDRRAEPLEALHDRRWHDTRGATADRADRAQDVGDAGHVARHVFLDELAATAGLGDHRGNAVLRGDRHQCPGSLTGWCGLHGPESSVRVGHSLDARVEGGVKRLAVADEWDEILDQIAGVQVDRVVAFSDDLSEEAMREPLAPGSVGLARKQPGELG